MPQATPLHSERPQRVRTPGAARMEGDARPHAGRGERFRHRFDALIAHRDQHPRGELRQLGDIDDSDRRRVQKGPPCIQRSRPGLFRSGWRPARPPRPLMKRAACSARERVLLASATIGSPPAAISRPSAWATGPAPTIATAGRDWATVVTLPPGQRLREGTRPSTRPRGIIINAMRSQAFVTSSSCRLVPGRARCGLFELAAAALVDGRRRALGARRPRRHWPAAGHRHVRRARAHEGALLGRVRRPPARDRRGRADRGLSRRSVQEGGTEAGQHRRHATSRRCRWSESPRAPAPLVVKKGRQEQTLKWRDEVVAWTKHVAPTASIADSELVFVGYGVVAPEYNWDDYKGVDVKGKTLVMLVSDPPVVDASDPAQLDPKVFGGKSDDVLRPVDLQVRDWRGEGRCRRARRSRDRTGRLSLSGRAGRLHRRAIRPRDARQEHGPVPRRSLGVARRRQETAADGRPGLRQAEGPGRHAGFQAGAARRDRVDDAAEQAQHDQLAERRRENRGLRSRQEKRVRRVHGALGSLRQAGRRDLSRRRGQCDGHVGADRGRRARSRSCRHRRAARSCFSR